MKLRKKLRLLEDFKTEVAQTTKTEVAIEATADKAENTRTEVLSDVDAILTNLETLSAQMSEGSVTLNENFEALMKTMMSSINFGKAQTMLGDLEKALVAADQNLIDGNVYKSTEKIAAAKKQLMLAKEKAKGPQKEKLSKELEKLRDQEDSIVQYKEKTKAKADDVLAAFNTKLGKVEAGITGKLKDLLDVQKAQVKSDVKQAGLESKAQVAIKSGKTERAEAAKAELLELENDRKAIEKKIALGQDASADEIAELKGMQPFMKEIEAFTIARDASKKLEDQISAVAPDCIILQRV